MTIKKYVLRLFVLFFLNGLSIVFGMEMSIELMSPIDRVFVLACKNNSSLEFALKNGAYFKMMDPENGYTGLHYACKHNNLDRAKWFLKKDWSLLSISAKDNKDPLDVAIEYGSDEVKQYLLDAQFVYLSKNFSGHYFNKSGKLFLDAGANINAVSDEVIEGYQEMRGLTPLMYASINGEIEKIQFLLAHGADVNKQSVGGLSPVYVMFSSLIGGARESKRVECLKILLEHGVDVNITGPGNHSLFAVAVGSNSSKCVKMLLDRGIDVNVFDTSGHNALYEAVVRGWEGLLPMLFDAGVKPSVDREGVSLIHVASIRNNASILQELIKRGLDVDCVDHNGQTPLHYASEFAGHEVIKVLLDAGANINSVDKAGKTPVMLIKNNPNKKSLIYLTQEVRKHKVAQKNIQVIAPSVLPENTKESDQVPAIKNNHKKKPKKKKKQGRIVFSVTKDETICVPVAAKLSEAEKQSVLVELHIADSKDESVRIADQDMSAPQLPQIKEIKPSKESLIERVQKKVVDSVITPKTNKSFAQVAAQQSKKAYKQEKKITDGCLKIAVSIDPQKQLMNGEHQENPLAKITTYSDRVAKKMNNINDPFHSFSLAVEEELGYLVQEQVIQKGTKQHSPTIKYTIPAHISFAGGNNLFPGKFEFIAQDKTMLHRFFKPEKKVSKKKMKLMLPASTSYMPLAYNNVPHLPQ